MDSTTFLMQTAKYTVIVSPCGDGHIHVAGGFVSEVAPGETEENVWVNKVTGEVFRMQSNLAFSLN